MRLWTPHHFVFAAPRALTVPRGRSVLCVDGQGPTTSVSVEVLTPAEADVALATPGWCVDDSTRRVAGVDERCPAGQGCLSDELGAFCAALPGSPCGPNGRTCIGRCDTAVDGVGVCVAAPFLEMWPQRLTCVGNSFVEHDALPGGTDYAQRTACADECHDGVGCISGPGRACHPGGICRDTLGGHTTCVDNACADNDDDTAPGSGFAGLTPGVLSADAPVTFALVGDYAGDIDCVAVTAPAAGLVTPVVAAPARVRAAFTAAAQQTEELCVFGLVGAVNLEVTFTPVP